MYLNCKTYFSFRYGTFGTEELVKAAVEQGQTCLALTNINNTCDTWDFVDFCWQQGIKPVAGTEIRNGHQFCYLLLARNNEGFEQINRFLSEHLQSGEAFPPRPTISHCFVIYPVGGPNLESLQAHEFIGVQSTEINRLINNPLLALPQKLVIRQPVTFQNKTYYNLHRLLRAIDKNIVLSRQETKDIAAPHEYFVPPSELLQSFQQYTHIVINTLQLLQQCTISLEFHTDKTKQTYSATKKDDRILLEKLALDGLKKRYGLKNAVARQRVQKELKIIDQLGFNAYFLITCDIIRYASSQGFFHVGRGSGANSIVAFCLQITDVDPIELDLYFERFLNPQRSVPPDFDIDFSWTDRDEIIDYIFKRYGAHQVCLLGAYNTFQPRAILRELGKVYGLPKEEIDTLAIVEPKEDRIHRQIRYYGNLLKDFPNLLSVHACGMLISEAPLFAYTTTFMPPKGFATSQIDMFIAEKIGLFKIDILSQRGLGHIKDTINLVQQNQRISINIHEVAQFKKDPQVAAKIRAADTIGCFYIESPGMRQLLKKLRCDDYITLVAASSIIRPGVSQSGMMKQYIYRFHHPDKVEYLHPRMEELLKETYGVMVFQEDVLKVAHHFAGLDMSEADVLRRAMSGKYRSHKQFEAIKQKFFDNCASYGYAQNITDEVWRQIESFAGYSFSKAHSASFAVESYQSLYLKTYYPVEFMVAVINNFGGFYNREQYFHELKKTGATLLGPCVNTSDYTTSVSGTTVTMGLIHIAGLEEKFCQRLLDSRRAGGAFKNLANFVARLGTDATPEQINRLIFTGAFRATGKTKKELLWEANFILKKTIAPIAGPALFATEAPVFELPPLRQLPLDDALDEIEHLGFALCNPFELVSDDPTKYTPAAMLPQMIGQAATVLGYLVTSKPVPTIKKELMFFHTFIDAAGDWLDVVFFPPTAKVFPLSGRGFYRMQGRVFNEFGVVTLDVHNCRKMGLKSREDRPNKVQVEP